MNLNRLKEILKIEAEAIQLAADRFDSLQGEKALEFLFSCRGKVIVTGVGKSGLIAKKIAATMTSTGTLALFMHPVEARHGDLGMVSPGDVAILISNSGETDELLTLLPSLKGRQIPVIAIVGNIQSTLGRNANATLDASVEKEACPLNLAPTSSTILAMAIGDALAMVLMEMKNLTPNDFAMNHPAGRLGKRLILSVADLMHAGKANPVIGPTGSWFDILNAITQGGLGAVSVVNAKGQLLGVISDGDLRRVLQKNQPADLNQLTAEKIMTRTPITVKPETLAYEALQIMEGRASAISVLPVIDEHRVCLGLIRLHDIVRSGLE